VALELLIGGLLEGRRVYSRAPVTASDRCRELEALA